MLFMEEIRYSNQYGAVFLDPEVQFFQIGLKYKATEPLSRQFSRFENAKYSVSTFTFDTQLKVSYFRSEQKIGIGKQRENGG